MLQDRMRWRLDAGQLGQRYLLPGSPKIRFAAAEAFLPLHRIHRTEAWLLFCSCDDPVCHSSVCGVD